MPRSSAPYRLSGRCVLVRATISDRPAARLDEIRLCLFHNASQNLAFPVGLMNRPAVNAPAIRLDKARTAIVMHVFLTLLLGSLKLLRRADADAPPETNVVVVHDRDDARFGQIKEALGDHFMAGRLVAFFKLRDVEF